MLGYHSTNPLLQKHLKHLQLRTFEDFAVELVVNSNQTFHLDTRYSHLKGL